jgi:hypothetical protein
MPQEQYLTVPLNSLSEEYKNVNKSFENSVKKINGAKYLKVLEVPFILLY